MILVVCSVVDDAAAKFAEELGGLTAASVLTCRDLATGRCALRYPAVTVSTLTVSGQEVSARGICGVVNLLPAVFPDELYFYPEAEREYQAAEFHALLTFFLAALPCPVLNRPTAASLTGPYSGRTGWYGVARKLGIPLAEVRLASDEWATEAEAPREKMEAVCLHGTVWGADGTPGGDYARKLAAATRVEYLRATFVRHDGEVGLFGVSTAPNVCHAATRQGLIALCRGWAGMK